MWSGKQLVDQKRMKGYVDDTTKNNIAFKKMRDIISAWKYHQDATTKDILKKQSDRVAARFDSLESAIAAQDKDYDKIGLKEEWISFMKGRTDLAKTSAKTFLDDWSVYMNNAFTDGDENSDPNTKSNPNSRATRLAKLNDAYSGMGTWSSPF